MMKKILRLVILSISASVLLVALYNNVSASSVYLKAASIKTCPNGRFVINGFFAVIAASGER